MDIYNMKLHETKMMASYADIKRVAGGWIYTVWDADREHPLAPVFVPFHNEFQEVKDND